MTVKFPKFVSSDKELNITYDYRCRLYQRHVRQTPNGHVITEFLEDVPWGGPYNTINCAASHHFRDGRWMQDTRVLDEYADFWCTEGKVRLYSFPIADSLLAQAKVTGDPTTALALYPKLVQLHSAWEDHCADGVMYRQECGYDGMEYSISGDGIRPTLNSYMYADRMALSQLARMLGDERQAEIYRAGGEVLRDNINERLWNEKTGMYGVISDDGQMQNVREQIGYIPWIYGIPTPGKDGCMRNLLDPACFLSPYGLRTADASHPEYNKPFDHECLWNGPIWPFATSQTMTAVIAYLHSTAAPQISHEEFMGLLLTYAYSHRDVDGTPWLDENMDAETGIWIAREILRQWKREDKNRGRHYNHSTFIDLVMTGICGICPDMGDRLRIHPLGTCLDSFCVSDVHYHGHVLCIEWSKNTGLKVMVDGKLAAECGVSEKLDVTIQL